MNEQPFTFKLPLADFDLSRLPISADLLREKPDLMAAAVSDYYTGIFQKLGGTANVLVAEGVVDVSWFPQAGKARDLLFDQALSFLQRANYHDAEPLLQSLYRAFPEDADVLFNYGMLLSDQGLLGFAIRLLRRLVALDPGHSHGWTALGVALVRSGDKPEALQAFKEGLKIDPSNAYALRNAGAILGETEPDKALPLFEKAASILPGDQQTLIGLATCLLRLDRTVEADTIFQRCVELNPLSDTAEHARTARTRIAHETMRERVGGGLRPDVVMYCLGALQKFRDLGPAKTQAITFEVAMLGRNGLDINDPAPKYTLNSLPGKFSGMHLVSIMYVGMHTIAPGKDAGIDLSREYAEAKKLFQNPS
ncbi:MAG: tetratricopeptide repeat protein [Verrucomicrobiota bacterium]